MKKVKILLLVTASIALSAFVYYLLVFMPRVNKEKIYQQARNQAISVCQKTLDQARTDYSKMKSLESEWIAHGYKPRITQTEWNQYENIFTPQWFQSCIQINLTNYGY